MSLALYEKIKANKTSSSGEFRGIKYGICEMQGWRNEMEDSNCIFSSMSPMDEWSFYAVFDGHGGSFCSKLSSEFLWGQIYEEMLKKSNFSSSDTKTSQFRLNSLNEEEIINSIKNGFYTFDRKLFEKIKSLETDDKSGTTVVAALITSTHIYLINCGDSRGILIRGNQIELNTFDHKPTQLKERQRIQNAGGLVALNRVNGGLATSRGLGDFEYKSIPHLDQNKQFVTCEPDIYVVKRNINDKFIILACDGIWDVIDNEGVRDFMEKKSQDLNLSNERVLEKLSEDLLTRCFEKGSKDNMSVITIYFNPNKNMSNENEHNANSARNATLRKDNSKSDFRNGDSTIPKVSSSSNFRR